MTEKKDLIQFYIDEYRKEAKKRNTARASRYEKRINALNRTMKRLGAHQVSISILEDYHRQIKNLLHIAMKYRNKGAVSVIQSQMIPEWLILIHCHDARKRSEGSGS